MTAVDVRYEDSHLAVINKPSGLLVHATGQQGHEATLVDHLERVTSLAPAGGDVRPGIVHRLDRDTSGLLVVAKTDSAFLALQSAIEQRLVQRRYLALVVGALSSETGRIEAPIGRSPSSPARSVKAGGKPAASEFRVLEKLSKWTYVEVGLETGRTHQIRVHMNHIGHPVAGDMAYGARLRSEWEVLDLSRPFLHSYKIRFDHPITEELIEVTEDLPDDLAGALTLARSIG